MPPRLTMDSLDDAPDAGMTDGDLWVNPNANGGMIMRWNGTTVEWEECMPDANLPPAPDHPMQVSCEYQDEWDAIDQKYGDLQSLRDQYVKAVNENPELNRIRAEYDRLHEKYFIFEELSKPYDEK